MTATRPHDIKLKRPVRISSRHFQNNSHAYCQWLLSEAPVHRGKIMGMTAYLVSKYEDCVSLLKDPRFVRNRTTARGGGRRSPFPLPKSVRLLATSMITEDEPNHRRLRRLVHKAFTPRAVEALAGRIDALTHELLDRAEQAGTIELTEAYALPIPVTVISGLLGIDEQDMPQFQYMMGTLSDGLSGWSLLTTMLWRLPRGVKFVRHLLARKRANPGDDILTALVNAEDEGERLTEDELISMTFLLVLAGYETTVHLINNCVVTLRSHPQAWQRLLDDPALIESAIEEVLRFNGPVRGTKPCYPTEDVTLRGVTIPRGAMVMPVFGAANFDPEQFPEPEVFDIGRTPNKHLGFGQGIHYCLGAPLARLETRIALENLLARFPSLRLTTPADQLPLQVMPMWHRYKHVPIELLDRA